jgi:hypothetical protein
MIHKIIFSILAVSIFIVHLIFSLPGGIEIPNATNSILLSILVVLIGILFSIKKS